MSKTEEKPIYLNCVSINGARTREPLVQVTYKDETFILRTDEARNHANALLEAAEAAETDAFLFEFVKDELKQDNETAGTILVSFREWRVEKERQATYKRKDNNLGGFEKK